MLGWQASLITGTAAVFDFVGEDKTMLPEGVTMDKISVYPLKVGTAQRIAAISSGILLEDLDRITVNENAAFDPKAPEIFRKYSDSILDIVCIGIHNKQSQFPEYLKKYLEANCTWEDLHILLNAVLFRMGTMSFISSTTDLKRVGLQSDMELIAMQKNLKSWGKN